MVEEDFLSDDDSVDFDVMVDIPPNRADNGHEAYLSPTHAGNKLKDELSKLATKYSANRFSDDRLLANITIRIYYLFRENGKRLLALS